jgi:L-lysine 6-transaminase
MEIIEEDNLVEHAGRVGIYLQERLHGIAAECPSVRNVRGLGLMCAFDLPSKDFRNRVLQKCYEDGLIILGCGTSSIRFRSPLTISKAHIDQGIDLLTQAIKAIEEEYKPYGETWLRDALTDG